MKTTPAVVAAIVGALGAIGWSVAWPQTTGKALPPLVIASMAGSDLYGAYCASCHGADGRGSGPTAPALKVAPPDLTTMARRNGGVFPRDRVVALVTHGETLATPAHGSSRMPVWGPIFLALEQDTARTKVRLDNIVAFVEAMQVK